MMMLSVVLAGCNETTAPSGDLAGSYSANLFRITASGESEVDVLAAGGVLEINIAEDNTTTGTLDIPGSITGAINASMAGTAVVSGSTVTFQQDVDTFMRDLSWARGNGRLTVYGQVVNGTTYRIALVRE